jgi:SOS-response transcriptional repressor LexA
MADTLFDVALVRARMAGPPKVTQADLAKVAGLNQSAISNIFKGLRRVKVEEAAAIYAFLGIRHDAPESEIQWVPLIGMSSAGAWREAVQDPRGRFPIPRGSVGPNAFAVTIVGDSMNKLIDDGGTVIVDPDQRQLYDKKSYLIANEAGEVTVKLYRSDPARFEPLSTNPQHLPLPIGAEQFTILGRAVHTVGNL